MKTTPDQFHSEVEPVRRQLEQWRRTRRQAKERIPEWLWSQISRLARSYGVSRASRSLGVQYYALKKRTGPAAAPEPQAASSLCQFVELALPVTAAPAGCVVELEDRGGSRMTLRLPSASGADAAALVEAFWRSRP